MNTFKHTPGPWLRIGTTVYALMHDGWKRGVEQFKNRFTVQVQRDRECSGEEAEADARLIAAAPEMLEALHKLVDSCDDSDGAQYGTLGTSFVRSIATAAIAKATQEPQRGCDVEGENEV
jgi:hypothetical protein